MKYAVVFLSVVLVVPPSASATAQSGEPRRLIVSRDAVANGLAAAAAAQSSRPRDSLRNGAVIGAVVGVVSAAVFGGYICHALAEEGDPPCWRSLGPILALGAGAGAAIGVGVDVLHARSARIVPIRRR